MAEWAGVVLAGGASTRMGRDKADLLFKGSTLLNRAVAQLLEFGAQPVVVAGNRPGFDFVPDARPGLGPLGGLSSVLKAREELVRTWLMILPVDMPNTRTRTLNHLARAARQAGRGAVYDSGPLPMALAPGPGRLEAVEHILDGSGSRSMARLADALGMTVVTARASDCLANLNRPEDLDAV